MTQAAVVRLQEMCSGGGQGGCSVAAILCVLTEKDPQNRRNRTAPAGSSAIQVNGRRTVHCPAIGPAAKVPRYTLHQKAGVRTLGTQGGRLA